MSTTPTNNSIPSESPVDLAFNAGKIDEFVNSPNEAYSDRFGLARLTIAGIENQAQSVIDNIVQNGESAVISIGFTPIDSFEAGAIITSRNQALHYLADNNYYRWDGALPKVVAAASAPTSSGGVASGAWVNVTDNTLRSQLASIAIGSGDSLVSVKQPFTGSVARTQHDKNADTVNMKDFGVKADGTTNDTAAFQLALDSGYTSFDLPDGTMVLSSGITYSGKPLRIKGKGQGSTFLKFIDTANDGIKITATNYTDFFDISDLTIIVAANPTAEKSAIWIDGSSQPDSGDLYNGIPVTGHRETKRGLIKNVNILPLDASTNGFDRGLRVTSLLNYSMKGIGIHGPLSMSSEGLAIDGAGVCVDIRLQDIYIYNVNTALMLPDYSEGIYLSESEFVNVNVGILEDYVSGRSVLLASQCGSNAHKIGPNHINAYTHCMFMKNSHFIKISKSLFINNLQNNPSVTSGVWIATTNWPSINDCMFFSPVGRPSAMFGIVGDAFTNGNFSGNTFQNYPYGYQVINASLYNNFSNSICYYNSVAVCVDIASSTAQGNSISNCTSDGTRYIDGGIGTRFQMLGVATQGALTVSVAATSITLNYPIGVGAFQVKPLFAKAEALGNTQIQYHYDYAASTVTNLVFYGTLPSGGVIATGTYPYSVMACNPA